MADSDTQKLDLLILYATLSGALADSPDLASPVMVRVSPETASALVRMLEDEFVARGWEKPTEELGV